MTIARDPRHEKRQPAGRFVASWLTLCLAMAVVILIVARLVSGVWMV